MNWIARPGTRISRLSRVLQPGPLLALGLLRRFFWPNGIDEDGIISVHNSGFRDDPVFQRCYARAVKAGGWDYSIRYRVHQALWCSALAQAVEGDFVELGTGRGFIMSALMESGLTRRVHLFDTTITRTMVSNNSSNAKTALLKSSAFVSSRRL